MTEGVERVSDKNKASPELPDDDRPITRLHIPYDMIIDPDRPKKPEREKLPLTMAIRWWCAGVAWLLLFSGVLFMLRARPAGFSIFVYMKGFTQNPSWDSGFMFLGRLLLGAGAAVCVAESIFLYVRQRRIYLSLLVPLAVFIILLVVSLYS